MTKLLQHVDIKIRNPQVVQECVNSLMSNLVLDEGRVAFQTGGRFRVYLEIVAGNVELSTASDDHARRVIVSRALFRFGRYKQHTLPMLRRALLVEAKRYLESEEVYQVLMLLNADDTAFRDYMFFDVRGTNLRIHSWEQLKEDLDTKLQKFLDEWKTLETSDGMSNVVIMRENTRPLLRHFEFMPILCEVRSCSPSEAVGQAGLAFDTLRALLNLQQIYGRSTYQGGRPSPLAKLLPSPAFGVFTTGGFQELYFTTGRYRYSKQQISPDIVKRTNELLLRLTPQQEGKQDPRDMLVDILYKYGQGLDTADWQTAFLFFWQILEIATLQSEKSINMDTVAKRTHNLIAGRQGDMLTRQILECLKRTRNELVHLGQFPEDGLEQVNLLKSVVDRVINVLFAKLDSFPDRRSLKVYYQYVTLNDTELETRRRVIGLIAPSDELNRSI